VPKAGNTSSIVAGETKSGCSIVAGKTKVDVINTHGHDFCKIINDGHIYTFNVTMLIEDN